MYTFHFYVFSNFFFFYNKHVLFLQPEENKVVKQFRGFSRHKVQHINGEMGLPPPPSQRDLGQHQELGVNNRSHLPAVWAGHQSAGLRPGPVSRCLWGLERVT